MDPIKKHLEETLALIKSSMTREELLAGFKTLTKYLKDLEVKLLKQNDETMALSGLELQKLAQEFEGVIADARKQNSSTLGTIKARVAEAVEGMYAKSSVYKKLNDVLDSLEKRVEKLRDGVDGRTPTEEELVSLMKPLIPNQNAEDIRDRLELLKGEERLDKSAIKGLDEIEKRIDSRPTISGGITQAKVLQLIADNAASTLTVQDIDSSPSVTNVNTIKFTNGSVTDDGSGVVTVTTGVGGGGDVSSNTASSVDSEIALFSGTGGKTIKRATGSGIATLTSGVLSATATTGSGSVVLATSPTLVTPTLGVASATSVNKVTLTAPATNSTLTIADGQTLTVNGSATITNGTHSGTNTGDQTNITGNAATVTVADAGGDTTTFPLLGTDATGSLSPATDAGLTYNATTNALTTTTFIGALTGNASTATSAATLTTPRTIGGTSFDGSANIVPATITVADTTDATAFVALFESATGDLAPKTDLGLTYAADTGTLTTVNESLTGYQDLTEIASPSSPASNVLRLWAEDSGGYSHLHFKDADGLDHELGRDNLHTVRNNTGSTITKGSWVYINGSTGVFPTIALARADSVSTVPVAGIVIADITTASFGQIMSMGDAQNINTSSFVDGDVLYLSAATAGLATTTPPTGTNIVQRLGVVVKSSVAAGIVDVLIGGEFNPTLTQTFTNKTLTSPNINEAVALTSTATELNILDGATLTTTELNYVDGVTSGIQAQLDAKVSNATHTGEVTGSTALTVDKTAITGKTEVTAVGTDYVLISDTSDSGNLKKALASDLGSGGTNTYFNNEYIDQSGGTSDTYGVLAGTINGSNALFTVSQGAYATGKLEVYLNGQLQTQGSSEDWVETTPASGTFTFATAPVTGSLITAKYQTATLSSETVMVQNITALPATDHTATGRTTNALNAGYTSAIGDLVFLGSGGKWLEVDADAVATCNGLMGIALEAKTDTQAMLVALPGSFVRDDTWAWTVGATLYAGETLGAMQETIPIGADAIIKVVGFAVSADVIYFNPSSDQQSVVA